MYYLSISIVIWWSHIFVYAAIKLSSTINDSDTVICSKTNNITLHTGDTPWIWKASLFIPTWKSYPLIHSYNEIQNSFVSFVAMMTHSFVSFVAIDDPFLRKFCCYRDDPFIYVLDYYLVSGIIRPKSKDWKAK